MRLAPTSRSGSWAKIDLGAVAPANGQRVSSGQLQTMPSTVTCDNVKHGFVAPRCAKARIDLRGDLEECWIRLVESANSLEFARLEHG
jgi:hypothetical protein